MKQCWGFVRKRSNSISRTAQIWLASTLATWTSPFNYESQIGKGTTTKKKETNKQKMSVENALFYFALKRLYFKYIIFTKAEKLCYLQWNGEKRQNELKYVAYWILEKIPNHACLPGGRPKRKKKTSKYDNGGKIFCNDFNIEGQNINNIYIKYKNSRNKKKCMEIFLGEMCKSYKLVWLLIVGVGSCAEPFNFG